MALKAMWGARVARLPQPAEIDPLSNYDDGYDAYDRYDPYDPYDDDDDYRRFLEAAYPPERTCVTCGYKYDGTGCPRCDDSYFEDDDYGGITHERRVGTHGRVEVTAAYQDRWHMAEVQEEDRLYAYADESQRPFESRRIQRQRAFGLSGYVKRMRPGWHRLQVWNPETRERYEWKWVRYGKMLRSRKNSRRKHYGPHMYMLDESQRVWSVLHADQTSARNDYRYSYFL